MRVKLFFLQTNGFTIKIKTWKKPRIVWLFFETKVVIIGVVVLVDKPKFYFDRLPWGPLGPLQSFCRLCIWYDDRFTQIKWSNADEVTLRAVLEMLFMYLCPHLVRRQMLKTPRASRTSVCVCVTKPCICAIHIYRDTQNMLNSYLNSRFAD